MDPEAAPGAVWLVLVAAGCALLVWTVGRARLCASKDSSQDGSQGVSTSRGSPYGPPPSGEFPDTRGPLLLAIVLWLVAPVLTVSLLRPEPGDMQPGMLLTLKAMELVVALVMLRAALGGSLRPAAGRARLGALACGGGIVTFALTGIATWLVVRGYVLLDAAVPTQNVAELVRGAGGAELAALVLSAVVVGPFSEEVLFRGLLFPALGKVMPARVALVTQAAVFGFVHFWGDPGKWALAIPLAVVGFCAGWLYQRTGSLWAAVGLHAVYNGIQIGFLVL